GGGERDYDNPSWNGYGDATFNTDVTDYGNNNTFDFVIAGTDDPNPFTTWNTVDIDKCIARNAEITAPTPGEEVSGMVDFEAFLIDDDADSVQWAVRQGTCAAGTNTVFGNVDGHSD